MGSDKHFIFLKYGYVWVHVCMMEEEYLQVQKSKRTSEKILRKSWECEKCMLLQKGQGGGGGHAAPHILEFIVGPPQIFGLVQIAQKKLIT